MNSKYIFLLLLFCAISEIAAQDFPKLKIENSFLEAKTGETIYFQISTTSPSGRVEMRNPPIDASLNDELFFTWIVPANYTSENVTIEFSLYDSTQLLDVKTVFVQIKKEHTPPVISISSNEEKNNGIYYAQPDESLQLTFTATGTSAEGPDQVEMSYFFNEDQQSTSDATIQIEDNKLHFVWNPNPDNPGEKYLTLTVIAKDSDNLTSQTTVLLVANKDNKPPYFTYPVLEEYYITTDEALEIDMSATDPNDDSLIYQLIIPSQLGNPTLSKKGRFRWKLNEDQMMRLRNRFPMTITVRAHEMGTENTFEIEKSFQLKRNVRNQPPKILNLQNESIQEGLTYQKTIFIEDGNDNSSDLVIDIRGAPEGLKWEFIDNMLRIAWTPGFDVIGVELQPKKYDMLLVVKDPYGYIDQKAFTLTVLHRENTAITYEKYLTFRNKASKMIEVLAQMHAEMEQRETKVHSMKRGLSVMTMFFAAYTAGGSVYNEGSFAKKMTPFIGVMAAVAGGINAFGFNDLNKYGSLRQNSFVLQQKLMSILAILNEYEISSKNSVNLENVEFRENLKTFEKWMVQDQLDFKNYYNNFKTLDYVKKMTRTERREAVQLGKRPSGLLFLDLDTF